MSYLLSHVYVLRILTALKNDFIGHCGHALEYNCWWFFGMPSLPDCGLWEALCVVALAVLQLPP